MASKRLFYQVKNADKNDEQVPVIWRRTQLKWRAMWATLPRLSCAFALFPIVLGVTIGIGCLVKNASAALPNIGVEAAFPLIKHYHARTIALMIVLGVAAREASMSQQHAVIHQRIIIIVVVTAEDSHHIATLLHGRKHAAIEVGRVGFLHTCAD